MTGEQKSKLSAMCTLIVNYNLQGVPICPHFFRTPCPIKNFIRHHVTGIWRLSIADKWKKTSLEYETYGAWVCKRPQYNLNSKWKWKTNLYGFNESTNSTLLKATSFWKKNKKKLVMTKKSLNFKYWNSNQRFCSHAELLYYMQLCLLWLCLLWPFCTLI